ncbi:flagellar biosynthesis anti-sigma factor FlgM [Rhodoferax sp. OV413]|uniref:flagellar biosynthesis anti-sigma factor FlgM n=1 Tax=Rhodoferax sp. OV413 TaxID=1855285 RepID=UPI0025E8D959|nr:flagellar biosynthesis anti-sigma factor FlgM [Rhodoferax sp. OV413]
MKIGQPSDLTASVASTASSAAQKAATSSNAAANASTNASQSTSSSGVALTVSTAAKALEKPVRNDVADVDMAKVQSVRASIQDGSFQVNAEAIADKLLSNAQEMLNRTSR